MKINLEDIAYDGDENTINTILDIYQEMAISGIDYINAHAMDIVTLDYKGEYHCALDILWDKQPNNYKLVLNIFVINNEGNVVDSKEIALKEIISDGALEKIMTKLLMEVIEQKELNTGGDKLKFKLGKLVTTKAVNETVNENTIIGILTRYQNCDWGDLSESDKELNDLSVKNGDDNILAAYDIGLDEKVYIITEADRSVTTILFASEY